jgi:hypothetical protein
LIHGASLAQQVRKVTIDYRKLSGGFVGRLFLNFDKEERRNQPCAIGASVTMDQQRRIAQDFQNIFDLIHRYDVAGRYSIVEMSKLQVSITAARLMTPTVIGSRREVVFCY